MKKLIIILGLIGCSEKRVELINEIKSDTLITEDTMISSFANQIKGISKSIKSKDVYTHKYEDSLSKKLKNANKKNKSLEEDADFYINAINGYGEIVGTKGVIDAYMKAGTKDTTK
jgi:hypothetical protein